MPTNDFLTFAAGGGANVESQAAYSADTLRTNGNQPGVAVSALNNKAIRQANAMVSQQAQAMCDILGVDVLDDTNSTKLLAQIKAMTQKLSPKIDRLTSTSGGTYNAPFYFFIASGSATAGATYTNNAVTFTVVSTVASATLVQMTGNGAPAVSGTLTKSGGTGDSTLTFYAVRAPLYLEVEVQGAGGGGQGSGTASGTNAVAGGSSTFGSSLITCTGGGVATSLGGAPGAGGSATINSPAITIDSIQGGTGGAGSANPSSSPVPAIAGGMGGANVKAGAPPGGLPGGNGSDARANTGAGGGGGGMIANTVNSFSGSGGSAGGYAKAIIPITSTYSWAWTVGTGGAAGGAGTSGRAGGLASDGVVIVKACYQ